MAGAFQLTFGYRHTAEEIDRAVERMFQAPIPYRILKRSVDRTRMLLKQELEIKLGELEQQWHWDSLERIFIEERIYRRIEKSKTWESVLEEIREGLKPFLKDLRRPVTDEDITRLTEIRIKRISAYNRFQAEEAMKVTRPLSRSRVMPR